MCLTATHPVGDGYAWWTLPPGVRSFNATEYGGFEESIVHIEKAWTEQGPFDAIIGFSQGVCVLAVGAGMGVWGV